MKPLIKVKNLNVTYFLGRANEVRALKNINFEIFQGEFIVFFGPSGCGKSTLLYSIADLEKNTQGDIFIEDKKLDEFSSKETEEYHQKKTGMIFQAYYLINSLSVKENVILPQIATGTKVKDREENANKLLDHFSVKEQATKLPNELSGGQQQRVAICRSLINNPDILFADEPVGNLDSKSAEDVMILLKELNTKQKKTIILVTHNPAYLNMAHRVLYIKDGSIINIKTNSTEKQIAVQENKELETTLSKELELLARTFSSISGSVGNLLIPFKAKQIVSECLIGMTEEEINGIEKKVENLLVTGLLEGDNTMLKYLDDSVKKGGLGMNKTSAEKLSNRIVELIKEIKFLEERESIVRKRIGATIDENTEQIRQYLLNIYNIKLSNEESLIVFDKLISARLNNKIDKTIVEKKLDLPIKKGGVGLDRRIARKVAKRLELLILGKYK